MHYSKYIIVVLVVMNGLLHGMQLKTVSSTSGVAPNCPTFDARVCALSSVLRSLLASNLVGDRKDLKIPDWITHLVGVQVPAWELYRSYSDGSTVVIKELYGKIQIHRFKLSRSRVVQTEREGLTDQEMQELMVIVRTYPDVAIFLQDVYTKNHHDPRGTITLTQDQNSTFFKLPSTVRALLTKRYKIQVSIPDSTSVATSSGTTGSHSKRARVFWTAKRSNGQKSNIRYV